MKVRSSPRKEIRGHIFEKLCASLRILEFVENKKALQYYYLGNDTLNLNLPWVTRAVGWNMNLREIRSEV